MFKSLQGVKPWEVNVPFSERAYFSVATSVRDMQRIRKESGTVS